MIKQNPDMKILESKFRITGFYIEIEFTISLTNWQALGTIKWQNWR